MLLPPPCSSLFPYTTLFRSPLGFDLTVTSLFAPLLAGRPVELLPLGSGVQTQQFHGTTRERSEEHTSELQSQFHLVCRLLLEKKKKKVNISLKITIST